MKYNRFLTFKKITNKVSSSRIEIPFRYAIAIGTFSIIATFTSLISPYLYKLLVDNVMIAGQLNMLPKIIISMIGIFGANIIISAILTNVSVLYFIDGMFIIWRQISIGSLLMFMIYMASLSMNVDSIINSITGFIGNHTVFYRIFRLLDTIDEEKQHIEFETYDIEVQKITFTYAENLLLVLKGISYKFEHGKKYLIVGKSGEGKSTLIKLILCMITPNSGKVMIGNIDLRNISQPCLFCKIGAVMQENQFFNLSVNENLKMIAPYASDEDIKQAARLACIDDFIESLPDGYNTIIGERGVKLSGGKSNAWLLLV